LKNINLRHVYWIPQAWEVGQAKETGTAMEKKKNKLEINWQGDGGGTL